MDMFRKIARAVKLIAARPGRALLILRMACWVTILSTAVKWYSLPRALQMVAASPPKRKLTGDEFSDEKLASAIDVLLNLKLLIFKPICWKRAAILHRYLTLRGETTTINFGVRRDAAGKLDGHAWLEKGGEVFLESQAPDYTVTYVFPSSAPFEIELASLADTSAT